MRIVTFNIKHGAQANAQLGDPHAVALACSELDADIVALQEVDRRVVRSRLADVAALAAKATGMQYIFAPTMRIMGGWYGNALLFRGSLLEEYPPLQLTGGFRYKMNKFGRRWDIKPEPRNVILARLHVGGIALSVAATHLSKEQQIAQRQIPQVVEELRQLPGPHLLLGDLNVPRSVVEDIELPEGFYFARVPAGIPASSPKKAIDHIALSGLEVAAVHNLQMPFSDHRALIAEVQPID